MAQEKSVLSKENIGVLLKEEYAVSAVDVKKIPLGTANCYKISTAGASLFLKEFPGRFTREQIEREAHLTSYLADNGFPTTQILQTVSGLFCVEQEGHCIYVQQWIDGKTYESAMPANLLMESARLLGRLHQLLRDYPLPVSMDAAWVHAFSAEKYIRQYDDLLAKLEEYPQDPHYSEIRGDLIRKRECAAVCEKLMNSYDGITYTPTHGDYSSIQLICDDAHIAAVIDFSSACTLPTVWEIMRSYTQSCAQFDADELCEYVRQYRYFAPLSEADLAGMVDVYLFQLLRSRYGYKEYLMTQTENREELLRFARKRTEWCMLLNTSPGKAAVTKLRRLITEK
ncbi:MAG: hypothetical protein E7662_01955 [Ruminococcaceae bacterium]|nr:hypothetical protein [Oscillospiraceae bacterium]